MFKRIFFPIAVVTVCVIAYLAWSATHYVDKLWQKDTATHLAHVAKVVADNPDLLTASNLKYLMKITGSDVLIYDYHGELTGSTLPAASSIPHAARLPQAFLHSLLKTGHAIMEYDKEGAGAYMHYFQVLNLAAKKSVILSLLVSTSKRNKYIKQFAWQVGLTAFSCLLFLWIFSFQVTKWVTESLGKLGEAVEKARQGQWNISVHEGGPPEVRKVAKNLNALVSELQAYKQRLQENEREITAGALASGLAHEIRNPLTSLKMAAQMLVMQLEDFPEEQKRARKVVEECDRLHRITTRFLGKKRKELSKKQADLNKIIERVVDLASQEARKKNVRIGLELATGMPPLMIDSEKIEQVIWNLVKNGVDVSVAGGAVLVKSFLNHDGVRQKAVVRVEDNGPGFDEEAAKFAFKPFYTTKPDGIGLGLAISWEIVNRHGGDLKIGNRPGGGAFIEMALPV